MHAVELLNLAQVITLQRRADRLDGFRRRYFEATGRTARESLGFDGKRLPIPSRWETSAGAFGACLAHVASWARALSDFDYTDETPFAFFEDDAVFYEPFFPTLEIVADLLPDDWDVLYLGGELLTGRELPTPVATGAFATGRLVRIGKAKNVNRLHAYIVKARALRSLFLRLLSYLTNAPKYFGPSGDETCFDYEVGRMTEEGALNAYVVMPFIVGQGGYGSDTYPTTQDAGTVRYWNNYGN